MINFIYGRAGSGKTSLVCKKAAKSLEAGRRVFLIVPEQMAVDAEARMTSLIGDRQSLNLEILNFRRLCNRIFREYGGLSYNYITKSGKKLMMWQTLTELSSVLQNPPPKERGSIERALSAITEFKTYKITPRALELASKKLELSGAHSELSDKLSDLALIFASYINLVGETMDDAADDLTKAAELLSNGDLFSGADVFFDAFNGYTPQELDIIKAIFKGAANVTVSVCLDNTPERSRDELFANQKETALYLLKLAKDTGAQIGETVLEGNHRALSPELAFIEKHLWALDLTKKDAYIEDAPAVSLIECPNMFAECEAVATDILKRVQGGDAWRDFSVITRGLDRYDGIIDVIFEKYGIPIHISRRTDLTSKPLIKLILAALTLKRTNFRTSDMISYIKTGLAGLNPDEISALENYAETWSIRGAVRWSEEWTMNPLGYTAEFTEECANTLAQVNALRERVMLPLADLHAALSEAKNVTDHCKALYSYLIKLDIPKKLSAIVEEKRETDPSEAQETEQLWSILIDSLDELCTVMPDTDIDCVVLSELLTIIFDETDIGTIPCTVDEVSAGDAALARLNSKHVYVIGVNEGVFPLAPQNDGVFTDSERELLAELDLTLAGGCEYTAADERFAFYRALTCASLSLTVTWASAELSGRAMKPSFGITRLRAMFPDKKPLSYADVPLTDRLRGRANLLEYIAESDGTELGSALRDYCKGDTLMNERIAKLSVPLTDDGEYLTEEAASLISGGDLALTQTRLDTFVLCHFSYFCKHILRLEEKKPAKFDAADIGSFIHHILELFVSRAEDMGGLSKLSAAEIDLMVEEIITDYMSTICKITPDFSGSRLAHLFARLRRSSRILCKNLAAEFSQSRFTPAFFELNIGSAPDGKPFVEPLTVKLSDGSDAYIYGVADRVDIMELEDKLYVRVIDYKTGSKDFSMDDVNMGLNLQMLLYLFSIWKNGKSPKSALEYVKSAEIVPAGVLYFKAGVPTLTLDAEQSPESIEKSVSDMLTRKGLLLDDITVLKAMDKELSGTYLPIKLKKDGTPSKNNILKSLEDFSELLTNIENTVRDIGNEIKRGNASASPICDKKHNACKYCEMKPICRKNLTKGGA